MDAAKNISFNGQPIEFSLSEPYLMLVDPIILQDVNKYLDSFSSSTFAEIATRIEAYSRMSIGITEIKEFRPGIYQLSAPDFQACGPEDSSKDICDIDSAFAMVLGVDKIFAVSNVFTWERFDSALRSPIGDDSKFIEFIHELGGPFFGIIAPADGTDFRGDGRYKLKNDAPSKLN